MMTRLEKPTHPLTVVLSERNLLALLSKLYTPGSACTIIKPDGLIIRAEKDDVHYKHPSRLGEGPGPMHTATENFIERLRTVLEANEDSIDHS